MTGVNISFHIVTGKITSHLLFKLNSVCCASSWIQNYIAFDKTIHIEKFSILNFTLNLTSIYDTETRLYAHPELLWLIPFEINSQPCAVLINTNQCCCMKKYFLSTVCILPPWLLSQSKLTAFTAMCLCAGSRALTSWQEIRGIPVLLLPSGAHCTE